MIGLGLTVGMSRLRGLARAIQALFAASEKGVWYDPSDLSTLYQESTGTTPVAAVGQPVGLMLDKSRGLVLGTELVVNGVFDSDTGWTKAVGTTIGAGTAVFTASNSSSSIYQNIGAVAGKTYLVSFDVLSVTGGSFFFQINGSTGGVGPTIIAPGSYTCRLTTAGTPNGNISLFTTGFTGTVDNISVKELPGYHATQSTAPARPILARHPISGRRNLFVSATDIFGSGAPILAAGSYVFSFYGTGTVSFFGTGSGSVTGTSIDVRTASTFTVAAGTWVATVAGDVRFAQVELGSTPTAYQKVTSTYDVTEAGVADAYHLKFDGVDDFMVTPSIDFSATDKMSVLAGTRKIAEQDNMVVELSANATGGSGTFYVTTENGGSTDMYLVYGRGTSGSQAYLAAENTPAPFTSVVTGLIDISGDSVKYRREGGLVFESSADMGTGNFGNYPLYIGMRAGTALPFNGNLYSLIVRGALSDAAQIDNAEKYVNSKTGAYQ